MKSLFFAGLALILGVTGCQTTEEQERVSGQSTIDRNIATIVKATPANTTDTTFVKSVLEKAEKRLERSSGRGAKGQLYSAADSEFLSDPEFAANARHVLENRKNVMIIGGKPTMLNEFMDCVAVGSKTEWCCSGTLIASNAVLTAGHCTTCGDRVFFGSDVRDAAGKVVRVIKNVAACRNCGPEEFADDLRLLILERDVEFGPRKLGTAEMIDSDKTKSVRLAGFGATVSGGDYSGTKYKVDVPLRSRSCSGNDEKLGCHKDTEFVAGKRMLGKDSCNGDSGGPAYVLWNDEWYLSGATSRMTADAKKDCGDGGIYVRVDKYRPWLRGIPDVHWVSGSAP